MSRFVTLTLLGTAQDAGLPQAGCGCERCSLAHVDSTKIRFPVSLGIRGLDDSNHLIEVTRRLPAQLSEWASSLGEKIPITPDSVTFTHLHLGHIEGLGQFGKPAMAMKDVPIYSTRKNIDYLGKRIDFKLMVDEVRNIESALGEITYELTPNAKKNMNGRRSLYASEDIVEGESFTEKNIKSVRPAYGLHPKYFETLLGKKAIKNILKGDRISWNLVDLRQV